MASISKVTLPGGTTYSLKDERFPDYINVEAKFLRSDGEWEYPLATYMVMNAEYTDENTGLFIESSATVTSAVLDTGDGMMVVTQST